MSVLLRDEQPLLNQRDAEKNSRENQSNCARPAQSLDFACCALPPHVTTSARIGQPERPTLEIEKYRPHPDKSGMLQFAGNISLDAFADAVRWFLETEGYADRLDYHNLAHDSYYTERFAPLPKYHYIAVFAVTGGSEGHYIHIEWILKDGSRKLLYVAKTFEGMAFAYEVCAALALFLQA